MKQILAGRFRQSHRIELRLLNEGGDQRLQSLDVIALHGFPREQPVPFRKSLELGRPQGAGFVGAKLMPVDDGARPRGRMIPRQFQGGMSRQQRVKDPRAIQVVNPLGVTFPVTRPRKFPHEHQPIGLGHRQHLGRGTGGSVPRAGGIRPGAHTALLEGLQQAIGKVLGPVNLRVFGHHLLIPDRREWPDSFRP